MTRPKKQTEKVLRMRFGRDDTGDPTLEEIGTEVREVRERTRCIDADAVRRLGLRDPK